MAWTEITRAKYRREGLRYASDTTDGEWSMSAAELPPAPKRGRPRTTPMRAVVEALFYLAQTGCQWRLWPQELPPYTTGQRHFYAWRAGGVWPRLNHIFLLRSRQAEGRRASPAAGVSDSQSVKTTEAGGPRGFDAGKKIKGRKRHILTDTSGLLVGAIVHAADPQDRDGAPYLWQSIHSACPRRRQLFADSAYAGAKLRAALAPLGRWTLEIVKRADAAQGFVLLPRRWVVERTLAWLNRNRRLAKDFEATVASAETWLWIASVKLIVRRLARA